MKTVMNLKSLLVPLVISVAFAFPKLECTPLRV